MLVIVHNLLIILTTSAKKIKLNKIDEYYDQIEQKKKQYYDQIKKTE